LCTCAAVKWSEEKERSGQRRRREVVNGEGEVWSEEKERSGQRSRSGRRDRKPPTGKR
jgi:hypothetical protein